VAAARRGRAGNRSRCSTCLSRRTGLLTARGDSVRGSGSGAVGGSGEGHLPRAFSPFRGHLALHGSPAAEDASLSDPAGREHLAGVALEPRDDARMIDIDDERRGRGRQVARKGDEAGAFAAERHHAYGHLEIGEGRATRTEHTEASFGVTRDDAAIRQQLRDVDPGRCLRLVRGRARPRSCGSADRVRARSRSRRPWARSPSGAIANRPAQRGPPIATGAELAIANGRCGSPSGAIANRPARECGRRAGGRRAGDRGRPVRAGAELKSSSTIIFAVAPLPPAEAVAARVRPAHR
jgi:hypothetical protein